MKRIVAVDDNLSNVRQALEAQGYQVCSLDQGFDQVDVVVVSGMDNNELGDNSTVTDARIIHASGLSADQVVEEVQMTMQLKR